MKVVAAAKKATHIARFWNRLSNKSHRDKLRHSVQAFEKVITATPTQKI